MSISIFAQSATSLSGLFNTGETISGTATTLAQGAQQSSWYVSYASINGGVSSDSTFTGEAYTILDTPSGYASDTNTAEWIVTPGASNSTSHTTGRKYVNKGGNYLPGNGTGTNEGIYVYTLEFDIIGTGAAGTVVTTPFQINTTLAADDGFSIYVNPDGYNVDPTNSPLDYSGTSAFSQTQGGWNNTVQTEISNYEMANTFYIGENYLSVVVDNTNSISGNSSSTTWNQSGLLMYNTSVLVNGNDDWSNGRPVVPEPRYYGLIMIGAILIGVSIYKNLNDYRKITMRGAMRRALK